MTEIIPATPSGHLSKHRGIRPVVPAVTRHFVLLDGLRGVAALSVVSYHISLYFKLGVSPAHAYLAVDFFFMLSGFVIAHSYDHRLGQDMGPLMFLKLRLLRLYPMVLFGVALGTSAFLAWAAMSHSSDDVAIIKAAATNALLLPSPALSAISPWAFPVDTPLWSLAFELWINLVYAIGFRLFAGRGLWLACGVGAVLLGVASVTHGGLNIGYAWRDFYLGAARVLFPFMFGVLLARHRAAGTRGSRAAHFAAFALLILFVVPLSWGSWFDIAAVLIGFPVIVSFGCAAAPNRWIDPVWTWLGAISYPLYAIHYPIVVACSNVLKMRHLQAFAPYAAFGTLMIAVAMASAATVWYDDPVRAWLKRKFLIAPGRVSDNTGRAPQPDKRRPQKTGQYNHNENSGT